MQRALQRLTDQSKSKDKQIALLEEKLENLASTNHRLTNEKLALISGTPRETTEHSGTVEETVREVQKVPKGETL